MDGILPEHRQQYEKVLEDGVGLVWNEIRNLIADPLLTPEENREMMRRIPWLVIEIAAHILGDFQRKIVHLNANSMFKPDTNHIRMRTKFGIELNNALNLTEIRKMCGRQIKDGKDLFKCFASYYQVSGQRPKEPLRLANPGPLIQPRWTALVYASEHQPDTNHLLDLNLELNEMHADVTSTMADMAASKPMQHMAKRADLVPVIKPIKKPGQIQLRAEALLALQQQMDTATSLPKKIEPPLKECVTKVFGNGPRPNSAPGHHPV